jgi:hypothetical protein
MFFKKVVLPTYGANQIYSLNCANHKVLAHVPPVEHLTHAKAAAWLPSSLLVFH